VVVLGERVGWGKVFGWMGGYCGGGGIVEGSCNIYNNISSGVRGEARGAT